MSFEPPLGAHQRAPSPEDFIKPHAATRRAFTFLILKACARGSLANGEMRAAC
jgi:hypothetical protein